MDGIHFIIFKPYGYLTQFVYNESTRKNRKLLGELGNFPKGIMAIGRLDQDSEGLLLLTTNGKLSAFVNSSKIEKEYHVQTDGIVIKQAIEKLKNGVQISIHGKSYQTKPCKVFALENTPNFPERSKKVRNNHRPTTWLSITITEGKFRQVRKMTAAVGFPTLRLVRVRIGAYKLPDNVKAGDVIKLSTEVITKKILNKKNS